jgi:hypothetical protein
MCNRISFVPTGITCHHFGKLTPHTYARALAADGAADGAVAAVMVLAASADFC